MSDYIRELEAELVRAGRERQRQRTGYLTRRVPPVSFGGVLTAFGLAAAIVVAILAVVLLGAARPRPRPTAGAAGGIPASARSLVAELAVLRRPQTAADRSDPAALLRTLNLSAGHGDVIAPGLTRLLAILPAPGSGGSPTTQERVFLIVALPGRAAGIGGRPFAALAAVDTRGGAGPAGGMPTTIYYTPMSALPGLGGSYNTTIVPDRVTRVRWDFDGQYGGAKHPRRTTVYATVRDNLAFAPASRYQGQVTRVIWYGAHQRIVKTFTGPDRQATQVLRVPDRQAPNRFAPFSQRSTLLAQINLQPPSGGRGHGAGIIEVLRQGSTLAVTVLARGLAPNTKHNAYAVWLYASPSQAKLLGFVNPGVRSNGRLKTAGVLPSSASHYPRILITRETSVQPRAPGQIVLEGKLSLR